MFVPYCNMNGRHSAKYASDCDWRSEFASIYSGSRTSDRGVDGLSVGETEGSISTKGSRRGLLRRKSIESLHCKVRRELGGLQRRLANAADDAACEARRQPERPTSPGGSAAADPGTAVDVEDAEVISSLRETIDANEETIGQLRRQLSETKSQKESAERELFDTKKMHAKMKKTNFDLIQKMAAKASEKLRSRDESTRAEVEDWKEKCSQMGDLYDALVEKVEQLSDENRELVAKIQKLEEDKKKSGEELAAMEGAREERDILRQSLEEAIEMATGMGDDMERIARDHKSTVDDYEKRLVDLRAESDLALEKLKEENDLLRAQFSDALRYYEENPAKAKGEKADNPSPA